MPGGSFRAIDRYAANRHFIYYHKESKVFYLVSYDVTSDRQRRKIAKLLSGHGVRIQYSVFECRLTRKTAGELKKKCETMIDTESDSVIFNPVCELCREKREIAGVYFTPERESLILC